MAAQKADLSDMKIEVKSADVPQANNLEKVLRTLVAIDSGCKTDKQIAKFIGFSDRQGRYYRRAVEIFGFAINHSNKSELTEKGRELLLVLKTNHNYGEILKPYVVEIPIVREILEQFETSDPVSPKVFLKKLIDLSELSKKDTTAQRRLSTITNWLSQVGLLVSVGDTKSSRKLSLIPYVPSHTTPNQKILSLYERFLSSLSPYLPSSESIDISEKLNKQISILFEFTTTKELNDAVKKSKDLEKAARLTLGISEKEKIDYDRLLTDLKILKVQPLTPERVLLERYRALKGSAETIAKGGNLLEDMIANWLHQNDEEFKSHYLFKGFSKNCDFFVPSLNLAIEAKYSKTSGTKHAGAIKDLNEISKAKKSKNDLLVGLVVAGIGFQKDPSFWIKLKDLYENKKIDFLLTPKDLRTKKPKNITRKPLPSEINPADLELDVNSAASWSIDSTDEELGLIDAILWLKRYSQVLFFNFESLLQTWISQTPFAVQCLRLILGWSESKMEGFIKASVPVAVKGWKDEMWAFDSVTVLVKGLARTLSEDEKEQVRNFFNDGHSYGDLVAARDLGLSGWAKRKKQSNVEMVKKAKANCKYKTGESTSITLQDGTKLKSSFSFVDADGNTRQVLCKFYYTGGSVLSDLAKSVESLSSTQNKDSWLLITDGPGWLSRDKDLRRLLSHAEKAQFQVMNLNMWESYNKAPIVPKRRIP